MRLIDSDKLLKGTQDHDMISTHRIWNAPTVDAIPIEWLREHRKQMRLKRSARLIENMIRLYKEEQGR